MRTAESVVSRRKRARSTDRRIHGRAPLDAPVLLDNDKAWRPARTSDVSLGGLGLHCEAGLDVGERVQVYFELPNRSAVEAEAIVVRCSRGRLGLRFVALDAECRAALLAHCAGSTLERSAALRQ